MAPSVKQTDKKTPSRLQEGERACAMKLRVYPTQGQEHRLGQWVYCAKRFRNEAVAFCQQRRQDRAAWLRQNQNSKNRVADGLSGFDANACSKWLTSRLQAARLAVRLELGIACSERKMMETVHGVFSQLSPGEKNEVEDAWLLTVPRTVFDQVLQDMGKTEAKAISDRKKAKAAGGKNEPSGNRKSRGPKLAGFPQFRKWRYPGSIRLQVSAEKNARFREHWEAGEVFIPGLGLLKFRDQGYVLPKTPPALITLSRDAAGQFHVAFLCVEKEYAQIKPSYGKQQSQTLPLDPETGFPVACAIDLSLTHLGVDDQGQSLGRKRHLKRFARALRRKNKSLARKQKGSQRWHKARRELGRLHVRIANCREAELRVQAKALVDRSAIVCLENYFLAFMLQNASLAESTHDAGLYRFKQLISEQCAKQGKLLLQCGRFDASTQICSACDYKHTHLKNNLTVRAWTCPGCAVVHDRDHNAAINILLMALTRAIGMQDVLSGLENCPGVPKASRVRLHPDLAAFIARGGLTAIVDHTRSTMRRRAEHSLRPGLDGAREARVSPKQPEHGRLERSGAG